MYLQFSGENFLFFNLFHQTDSWTELIKFTEIHTDRHTDTKTRRHTDTQTHRHTDAQTHRHTDGHRQTGTQTYIDGHRHTQTRIDGHRQTQTEIRRHTTIDKTEARNESLKTFTNTKPVSVLC
jgi:hypothetical protein